MALRSADEDRHYKAWPVWSTCSASCLGTSRTRKAATSACPPWTDRSHASTICRMDYELSSFGIKLISGGVYLKGIQAVTSRAEQRRDPATEDVLDSLRTESQRRSLATAWKLTL